MKIKIGSTVPRRGNFISRGFGRLLLLLMGWRLYGEVPDLPKMVIIGAPHTSNMDGVIGIATLTALGLDAGTMIKDTAFNGFFGVVLRWFGALPVNRASAKGVVDQSVEAFNSRERFLLLIAPEGTRNAPVQWKRGFYHVAAAAGAPILPAACNYKNKKITFGPLIYPSGDFADDMDQLLLFYRDHSSPRHPARLSKPICDVQGKLWVSRADQRP